MRPREAIAGALTGALCLAATAAQAECRTRWNAQFAAQATGTMWVTSDRLCVAPIYTGSGMIRSLTVTAPAAHGVASARGRASFAYQSAPGFVGRDRFVLAIDGVSDAGVEGVSRIVFDVVVSR